MGNVAQDDYRVHNFHALRNDKEALALLERIAAQVRPIMQKRKWRVGVLKEFLPSNPGLLGLNVNRGQSINIRLRHSEGSGFMDYHSLIGTMLHELCHNEIGSHSAAFYKLLDEITTECESLMARGITGPVTQAFAGSGHAVGRRGGGIPARPVGTVSARELAAQAALKRQARGGGGGAGGFSLGGGGTAPTAPGLTTRELMLRAAERRRQDNIWCGNNDSGVDSPALPGGAVAEGYRATTPAGDRAAPIPAQSGVSQGGSAAGAHSRASTGNGQRGGNVAPPVTSTRGTTSSGQNRISGPEQQQQQRDKRAQGTPRVGDDVIVLDDDDEDEPCTAVGRANGTRSGGGGAGMAEAGAEAGSEWTCRHCTFMNEGPKSAASICAVCLRTQH